MPVPGPRAQRAPLPGYRNPEQRTPTFINRWDEPVPTIQLGRSPGTMLMTLRGQRLATGQVRRLYKQKTNEIQPGAPYNQVALTPSSSNPAAHHQPVGISQGWRYMISSRYIGAGDGLSRWGGTGRPLHQKSTSFRHVNPTPTLGAGNKSRGRPTVRNRLTSFGSRVPTINSVLPAAEGQTS
jgi:hypothetical protein